MLRSLADDHRRLRGRPADALAADRDARRAGRRRRGGRVRVAAARHRQGRQRAEPSRDRGRDRQAVRARRRVQHDPRAPGLPGPALLPPLRRRPRRARASTRASRGSISRRSSPTTGTRSRSTPTTTRCRSSTSSRWCAPAAPSRRSELANVDPTSASGRVVVVAAVGPVARRGVLAAELDGTVVDRESLAREHDRLRLARSGRPLARARRRVGVEPGRVDVLVSTTVPWTAVTPLAPTACTPVTNMGRSDPPTMASARRRLEP